MKVKFEYSEELAAINEKLLDMPKQLEESEDKVLRKAGNAVKKNVVRFLHDSDVETRAKMIPPSNYDGSRPYIHMKDDVRVKLKTDKNGIRYVSIRGGKFTGYKWHFIDQVIWPGTVLNLSQVITLSGGRCQPLRRMWMRQSIT